MAPPKQVCSIYAEAYELYARLLATISDIRKALSQSIKIKNSILYGTLSVADAAVAELVNTAGAVSSAITSQLMAAASSSVSTAMDAVLAPILKILISGPEAAFSLIALPLEEAIRATDRERIHLNKAKTYLNTAISLFAKWTVGFGGGKYADRMTQALPYIIDAIENASALLDKLDVGDQSGLTAQFDENKYNLLRSDVTTAIGITKSDSILVNTSKIEARIRSRAENESSKKISEINIRFKNDKRSAASEYIASEKTIDDDATYAAKIRFLESKRKIDIENAKLEATRNAALDSSVYAGILNDTRDQFINDMAIIGSSLQQFVINIGRAYAYYKASQSMTYSSYTIRNLINTLISSMIRLIGGMGNGTAGAVQGPLRLAKKLLEATRDLYSAALSKYYSTTDSISATELASDLWAGHGMLKTVDTTLASSITQSMIDAINADETLTAEQSKMNILFEKIEEIPDWNGQLDVWGTDPSNSSVAPYPELISSVTGMLGTMAAVGFVSNPEARIAIRNRLSSNSRAFQNILRHNGIVSSALRSYSPRPNEYTEELRNAMSPAILKLFLTGPSAFNAIVMVARIGGGLINIGNLSEDLPTIENCKIAYADLFSDIGAGAEVYSNSLRRPGQFDNRTSKYYEDTEMKREELRKLLAETDIQFDGEALYSSESEER